MNAQSTLQLDQPPNSSGPRRPSAARLSNSRALPPSYRNAKSEPLRPAFTEAPLPASTQFETHNQRNIYVV